METALDASCGAGAGAGTGLARAPCKNGTAPAMPKYKTGCILGRRKSSKMGGTYPPRTLQVYFIRSSRSVTVIVGVMRMELSLHSELFSSNTRLPSVASASRCDVKHHQMAVMASVVNWAPKVTSCLNWISCPNPDSQRLILKTVCELFILSFRYVRACTKSSKNHTKQHWSQI